MTAAVLSTVAEFPEASRLNLGATATREAFEEAVHRFYLSPAKAGPLLVDLRHAQFVDVSMLCHCIALIAARVRQQQPTALAWPQKKTVRDFLLVWRFGQALSAATGMPLDELLVNEDRGCGAEEQTTYSGYGDALRKLEYNPDWRSELGGLRNFFEFVTFSGAAAGAIRPDDKFGAVAREEGMRWARPLVQAVLHNHLDGGSRREEIARVVIYESISNAVRHPSASIIQAVSRFDHTGPKRGQLRICVWDDGEGIVATLRQALTEGRSVHALTLPPYMCDRYHVQVKKFGQIRESEPIIVDQTERFDSDVKDARLLLGSLFPGVTRNVHREIPNVSPYRSESTNPLDPGESLGSSPGMGLYALQRAALDLFHGSIVIRSGRFRLELSMATTRQRADHNARYACKLTEYHPNVPPFRGNLLVIQLPLKAKALAAPSHA